MNSSPARLTRQTLALVLSFSLLDISAGPIWAAGNVAPSAKAGVPASLNPQGVGFTIKYPMQASSPLSQGIQPLGALGSAQAPLAPAAPLELQPQAAPSATPLSQPPLLMSDIVRGLEARGVDLSASEPAQIKAAIEALPQGAAKDALAVFAALPSLASGGLGSALNHAYDNAAQPSGNAADAANPASAGPERFAVAPEKLRWVPDAEKLPQDTASMTPPTPKIIGQAESTIANLEAGLRRPAKHANVVVAGPDASGRVFAIEQILSKLAPTMPTPPDLVQVRNFADPKKPLILEFSAGRGPALQQVIQNFVMQTRMSLLQALRQGPFAEGKQIKLKQYEEKYQKELAELYKETSKIHFGEEGRFGVHVRVEEIENNSYSISIYLTVKGRVIDSPEKKEKAIEDKDLSEEEYQQAFSQAVQEAQPLLKRYQALVRNRSMELSALEQASANLEQQFAKSAVLDNVQDLLNVAMAAKETPKNESGHVKLRKAIAEMEKGLEEHFKPVDLGPFSVRLEIHPSGGIAAYYEREGKRLKKGTIQKMLDSGDLSQEKWTEIQQKIRELASAYEAARKEAEAKALQMHLRLHQGEPAVQYALAVIQDAVANYSSFLPRSEAEGESADPMAKLKSMRQDPAERYKADILVSNAETEGAPVIFEANPTFERLFGQAETQSNIMLVGGMAVKSKSPEPPELTAGAYLKANGGYLVLDLMSVLHEQGVYETLMKAIRTGEVEMGEGGFMKMLYDAGDTQHIPAKVKVVFIGSPWLHMLVGHHDPNFAKYFDHVVEFDSSVRIAADVVTEYVEFIKRMIEESAGDLLDMTREAISSVLQYAARMAESSQKFSTRMGKLVTLMREAGDYARDAGRQVVEVQDVDKAVDRKQDKGLYGRHLHELQAEGIFSIPTEGAAVGQVNALTVMGNFGAPTRVSAVTVVPNGSDRPTVVAVDRNAELAGPTFKKGLEILEGFILNTFAQEHSFPLQIRLAKEQMYSPIDGDSSTSTNIYATLSSLSGLPIRQGIAITGSADQFGDVQAIGGVNHKIEGYFDVVKEKYRLKKMQELQVKLGQNLPGEEKSAVEAELKGLEQDGISQAALLSMMTGEQGVIIPRTNVGDLMLRPDIVEAVRQGKFHIWSVSHVSEGIEILTGKPYKEILGKIEDRLKAARGKPDDGKN